MAVFAFFLLLFLQPQKVNCYYNLVPNTMKPFCNGSIAQIYLVICSEKISGKKLSVSQKRLSILCMLEMIKWEEG